MSVSNIITMNYKNFIPLAGLKTNPIQTQFPKRPKMNLTLLATRDYRKKDDFAIQKNKPNPSGLCCLLRSCRTDQTQLVVSLSNLFQTRRRFSRLLNKRLTRRPVFLLASATLVARRGSGRKQDEGLAITFLGAFLQRVAARPGKTLAL